jgi:glycosyltransferase involved in cell wall biosynthesis
MVPQISFVLVGLGEVEAFDETVRCLARQSVKEGWETICVSRDTPADSIGLLREQGLPVSTAIENTPTVAAALNRGISLAKGDLISLISGGVQFSDNWLAELFVGAATFPNASVFCGPVVPSFPKGSPVWVLRSRYPGLSAAQFIPEVGAGVLPDTLFPFGVNCTFRHSVMNDITFAADLNSHDMGLPVEIIAAIFCLRDKGHTIAYLPQTGVTYSVLKESTGLLAQFERAFSFGRTLARTPETILLYPTSWLGFVGAGEILEYFDLGMLLNLYLGQLSRHQEMGHNHLCRVLEARIAALSWNGGTHFLCDSALKWFTPVGGTCSTADLSIFR